MILADVPREMEEASGVSAEAGVPTLDPSLYDSSSPNSPDLPLRRRVADRIQCCHADHRSQRRQLLKLLHGPP